MNPQAIAKFRKRLNIFKDGTGYGLGDQLTETQLIIADIIMRRRYPRGQLICPSQFGKSLTVALAVLMRVAFKPEKWAIIAPTEEKARIIMDYIIEHVFDDPLFSNKLEYNGTKEKLKQERSKTRLTFRGAGEVRVYTANANNAKKTKEALMGYGAAQIILDESALIPNDLYATVKRMLGGSKDNFLLEIGNPFYKNHFYRTWLNKRYVKVWIDVYQALKEGRYTQDYIDEMKEEAFFDVLYECHFPEGNDAPEGYTRLLSDSFIENAFIETDLPIVEGDKPVLGIDPNHGGSNYTVMEVRYPLSGFAKIVLRKRYDDTKKDVTGEIIADAIKMIKKYKIGDYRTAVDAGGVGAGVADGLEAKGYLIVPVLFGEAADDSKKYANKKAELFMALRRWIRAESGKLVKHDGFLELKEINYKENESSKVQMESKEHQGKRSVASCDVADSLALTFINTENIVEEDDIVVDDDSDYDEEEDF